MGRKLMMNGIKLESFSVQGKITSQSYPKLSNRIQYKVVNLFTSYFIKLKNSIKIFKKAEIFRIVSMNMKVALVFLAIAFISIVEVNLIPYRNSHNIRWKNEVDFNQGYGPPPFFPDDHPTGRIVGGTDAKSGQVSYQLFLRGKTAKGERYHCGAALINEYNVQFALTAAHCVYDGYPHHKDTVEPRNVRLTAGEISLKTKSGREQYRTPHRIVMHESFEYDEDHPHDDIAIVFYRKPFTINYYVQPIALPDYLWAQPPRMTISGWGSTTPEPHLTDPDVLQVVDQRTLDNYICGKFYKTNYTTQIYNIVDYRQICLLEDYRKVGFCEGDSGGPGTAWNATSAKFYLAGIGSFYLGECGDGDWPAVYTRVSAYTDWIRSQVAEYIRLHLAVTGG